jgi:hypothetical protein
MQATYGTDPTMAVFSGSVETIGGVLTWVPNGVIGGSVTSGGASYGGNVVVFDHPEGPVALLLTLNSGATANTALVQVTQFGNGGSNQTPYPVTIEYLTTTSSPPNFNPEQGQILLTFSSEGTLTIKCTIVVLDCFDGVSDEEFPPNEIW